MAEVREVKKSGRGSGDGRGSVRRSDTDGRECRGAVTVLTLDLGAAEAVILEAVAVNCNDVPCRIIP